ncbi:hypothetical protein Pmani_014061 [Petrolisthes manimaculis]|uniref:Uncharacterized protein n=1 Tax=Petrolisthes manimaculis TaxID=1843537 RepID=A0AAE1PUY8_9EUCA|nr:hypothetical protein Pmani_014061 [Petrolisthes manimaculis]
MDDQDVEEKQAPTFKQSWKKSLPKKDEKVVIKSVLAKFKIPKKPVIESPYMPPPEKDLFQYVGRTQRQLHQELVESGNDPLPVSRVRRGNDGMRGVKERKGGEQLGPPPRRRQVGAPITQPLTAREYLLAARTTAREKNLARVAEVEKERLEEELGRERAKNSQLEEQLDHHQEALQEFLQYHYCQVSEAISRGAEAKRNLTEQEIRIDYFLGLLAEARTVQEEEEERLQELTAFQQFLAAVTPTQSLRDLKRRMKEIQEEVKESCDAEEERFTNVDMASRALAASDSAADKCGQVISSDEGGSLGADLLALRMMKAGHLASHIPTTQSPVNSSQALVPSEEGKNGSADMLCDSGAFAEEFLQDETHLASLAGMYESQCHVLLSLLTRLQNQWEAIGREMAGRQGKLEARLQEIQQLQERAKGAGHLEQLKDLQTLISEWPRVSGDEGAQTQLRELVAQIAEVVSDVFGSSKYSPLVPQAPPQDSPTLKKPPSKSTNGQKGTDNKDVPAELCSEKPTVSAGMGQEALLALLEARVTDLCAELDTIDPALRDSIFLSCEQARSARLREEKRLRAETRRAERKQKHLERALAEPPQRPL